jgi:2-hydroxychromene-2-carboxylate isomerase
MPIPIGQAQSDMHKQRPQAFDDEAGELGIFGSSSFVADGEILSGDDRPEVALARARRA